VKRIYLDEFPMPPNPPVGLSILRLVIASTEETKPLATQLIHQAESEITDSELSSKVIELVGRWIVTRLPEMKDDEVEAMFQLSDIRKTQFWKDVHAKGRKEGRQEGREEGRQEGKMLAKRELARKLHVQGKTVKEIAEVLDLSRAQAHQAIERITSLLPHRRRQHLSILIAQQLHDILARQPPAQHRGRRARRESIGDARAECAATG
jgi:predicted transposase/invertase (TIGR01784 family)